MNSDHLNADNFWSNTYPQQMAVGLYLLFIGVLGTVANSLVLTAFIKFRTLRESSGSHLLLINLCVADLGMCIFGFPFSASSSFANRWLYGDVGCQMYAFTGFLFGSASIGTLTMLAWDRYRLFCNANNSNRYHSIEGHLKTDKYSKIFITIWLYAVFWSTMPLIGWGRYNYEPSKTTCTIDWRHNDILYKSLIIVYFILGYAVPLCSMIFSYYEVGKQMAKRVKGGFSTHSNNWENEKNLTKLSISLVISFAIFWSGYAIVCLWTVFGDPATVPFELALLPPLLAKASTVFNPLLIILVNKPLREAVCSVLTCGAIQPSFTSATSPETRIQSSSLNDNKGAKRKVVGNE